MNYDHQNFLEKYALPDEHYSYEHSPLGYIAKSKNITKEQLDKAIISDGDWDVRIAAARHPNLSKENLNKALSDEYFKVREAVAQHPNLTKKQLDQVLSDENWYVRNAAKQNPNYKKYYPNGHES